MGDKRKDDRGAPGRDRNFSGNNDNNNNNINRDRERDRKGDQYGINANIPAGDELSEEDIDNFVFELYDYDEFFKRYEDQAINILLSMKNKPTNKDINTPPNVNIPPNINVQMNTRESREVNKRSQNLAYSDVIASRAQKIKGQYDDSAKPINFDIYKQWFEYYDKQRKETGDEVTNAVKCAQHRGASSGFTAANNFTGVPTDQKLMDNYVIFHTGAYKNNNQMLAQEVVEKCAEAFIKSYRTSYDKKMENLHKQHGADFETHKMERRKKISDSRSQANQRKLAKKEESSVVQQPVLAHQIYDKTTNIQGQNPNPNPNTNATANTPRSNIENNMPGSKQPPKPKQ